MIRQLLKKSSIYFLGQLFSRLTTTLIYIWLARLFVPEQYGLVTLFILLLTINTYIFDLGLGQWYQKHVTDTQRITMFQIVMQIRLFLAIIGSVIIGSYLLLARFSPLYIGYFVVASLIDIVINLCSSYYLERKKPLYPSLSLLFRGVGCGLIMLVNLPHVTIYNVFFGYIIGGLAWISIWLPKRSTHFRIISFNDGLRIVKQSLHFAYLQMTSFAYARADSFVIASLLGTTPLGYYAIAYRYMETAGMFPSALSQNMFHIAAKEHMPMKSIAKLTVFNAFIGFVIAIAIFLSSNFLINNLLGYRYSPAVPVLKILSLAVFLLYLNAPLSTLVQSSHLLRKFLPFGIANTILNVVANVLVIPIYGIQAAAWIMVATELSGFLINVIFVKKYYE